MRYFLYFSYDGGNYHGWQQQPNAISVQEVLNKAISTLLQSAISLVGAGRTDTSVNAKRMVAHFDFCCTLPDKFTFRLNRLLPPDIAVLDIKQVNKDAHARFDALSRTYHYYIYKKKDPFKRHYATRYLAELDYTAMNQAAKLLLQVEDFTSFSKLHTDTRTKICHVTKAEWIQEKEDLWRFEITADRFLRNMVRAIVGTLIEVGRGRMSIEEFSKIIQQKNRCAAAESVPGEALFLVNIKYPDSLFLHTEVLHHPN